MTNLQKAIAILQKTADGTRFYQTEEERARYQRGDGWQLAMVQSAVNGRLTDFGQKVFDALFDQVEKGDWLYAIEEFLQKFVEGLA